VAYSSNGGAYVQKPNKTGIFPNDKRSSDTHPHFKGTMTLSPDLVAELYLAAQTGKDAKIDVSMWKQQSKAGKSYLSMSVQKAWEPAATGTYNARPAPARQVEPSPFDDDDAPF